MDRLIVLVLTLCALVGCGGAVDPGQPPATNWEPYPACSCGWVDDTKALTQSCAAPFVLTSRETLEIQDDGQSVCQIFKDSCIAPGRADCAATCGREHVTCQPTAPHGLP